MINQSIKQRPFVVSPTTIDNDTSYIVYKIYYYSLEAGENTLLFVGKGYPFEEFGVQKFEVDLKDFYETLRNKNTFRMEEHFSLISSTDLTVIFEQRDSNDNVLDTETISFTKDKEKMSIESIDVYNGLSRKVLDLKDFTTLPKSSIVVYPIIKFKVEIPDNFKPAGVGYWEGVIDTFLPISYSGISGVLSSGFNNLDIYDMSLHTDYWLGWVATNYSTFYDNFIEQKTIRFVPSTGYQPENTQTKIIVRKHKPDGSLIPAPPDVKDLVFSNDIVSFPPMFLYDGNVNNNSKFEIVTDVESTLNTYLTPFITTIQTKFREWYFPYLPGGNDITVTPLEIAYGYIVINNSSFGGRTIERYVEWQNIDIAKTPYPTLTFINSDIEDTNGNDVTVKLCEELGSLKGFTTNSYNQTTYKDKYDDTYVVQLDNKRTVTCYVDPEWFSVTTNKNRLNYVLLKDAMYSSRLTYLQTAVKTINNKKAEINGLTNPDDDDFAFLYGRIKSVEDVKIPSKYSSNGEKMPSLKIEFEIYE